MLIDNGATPHRVPHKCRNRYRLWRTAERVSTRYTWAVRRRRSTKHVGENKLWHGDNLDVLRTMGSESVDLVYLDPPFKSDHDYNMLYKERDGSRSAAQEKAFTDTWEWDPKAAKAYRQTIEAGGSVSDVLDAFRRILAEDGGTRTTGRSEMLAYLSMMAPRLVQLRRVLKTTGSLYLHCDAVASHYLKLLLDGVFGSENFRSEIIWKRTSGHSDATRYGAAHDTILFYTKSDDYTWNAVFQPYEASYVERYYRYKDKDGRRFMSGDIGAAGLKGGGYDYEWRGVRRVWRCPIETMRRLDAEGRIFYTRNGIPRMKRYLDESNGMPAQDLWADIEALRSWHAERIGFPTQKPVALLQRMIDASSNKGDTILDPFCGCGSTIEAAENLGRKWIGIDITHLAIEVIEGRLAKRGLTAGVDYAEDCRFAPATLPDVEALARKDKHAFQAWALQQAGVEPFQLKPGPDRGIDARKIFFDPAGSTQRREIIVSVKGGKLPPTSVRDLIGTVQRERAQIGVLISLKPPTRNMVRDAAEAPTYRGSDGRIYSGIQILTVSDLLDGHSLEYPLQLAIANPAAVIPPTSTQRAFELELQPLPRKMAKASLPLGFKHEEKRPRGRRR